MAGRHRPHAAEGGVVPNAFGTPPRQQNGQARTPAHPCPRTAPSREGACRHDQRLRVLPGHGPGRRPGRGRIPENGRRSSRTTSIPSSPTPSARPSRTPRKPPTRPMRATPRSRLCALTSASGRSSNLPGSWPSKTTTTSSTGPSASAPTASASASHRRSQAGDGDSPSSSVGGEGPRLRRQRPNQSEPGLNRDPSCLGQGALKTLSRPDG